MLFLEEKIKIYFLIILLIRYNNYKLTVINKIMTTILLEQEISQKNIKVQNITELYYFVINSPEFTEIWLLNEEELDNNSKNLLEKSRKSNNRINI